MAEEERLSWTHRRIAEYYYTLAPAVVAECGKGIIGQKWKVPITKDRDATLKRRIHEVEERLESDWLLRRIRAVYELNQ